METTERFHTTEPQALAPERDYTTKTTPQYDAWKRRSVVPVLSPALVASLGTLQQCYQFSRHFAIFVVNIPSLDKILPSSYIVAMKTKVSSKGQVVIPKAYRQKLGWENGTALEVHEEAGQLVLSKPRKNGRTVSIDALAGRLHRPAAAPISLQAMEDAITKEVRKRSD